MMVLLRMRILKLSCVLTSCKPHVPPSLRKVEELACDKSSFDEKRAPKVELKPLPSSLSYEFLSPNPTYLVIVNASLSISQIDSLLRVLRLH